MDKMNLFKKNKNTAVMMTGFFAAVVVAAVFIVLTMVHKHQSVGFFEGYEKVRTLESGWTMDDGERKIKITLPSRTDYGIESEEVTLTNVLPDNISEGDVMMYRSSLQALTVYVAGEEIYSYGKDEYRLFGDNNGSIYNIVPLSRDYAGKEIKLVIKSPYDDYKNTFNAFYIGKYPQIYSLLLEDHLAGLIFTVILFAVGVLMVAVYFIGIIYKISNRQAFWLGLFSLCVAGWEFTECKLTQIFVDNMVGASAVGFMFMALMPIPLLIYFDDMEEYRFHRINMVLTFLCVINTITQVTIQMLGVRDLYRMFGATFALVIICSLTVTVSTVIIYYRERERNMIPFLGALSFLVLMGCGEFLNMFRYGRTDGAMLNSGVLVFIVVCSIRTLVMLIDVFTTGRNAVKENAAKSLFLANISHEIRTPMNAICAMSEMLKDSDSLSPKDMERVRVIHTSANNLLYIINDILDFSKISTGKAEIVACNYKLSDMLYEVCAPMAAIAESKHLDFNVSVSPNVPEELHGDGGKIRQIIINLVSNAIKYTKKGSVSLCVDARKEEKKVRLIFSVTDTGIGIKKEALNEIFNAYAQVDVKRERAEDSTGLGLAISKGLARLMGGDITVQSSEDWGSIFTANVVQIATSSKTYYEYVRDSEKGIVYIDDRIRFVHADRDNWYEKEKENKPDASEAKILVVDDNSTNLRIMREMLASYGVKPVLVSSGPQALAAMRSKKFDLIFMDQMMPKMDGIETAAEIRKMTDVGGDRIKIIALTADAMKGAEEKFLNAGFDGYLAKPVSVKQIGDTLISSLPKELIS